MRKVGLLIALLIIAVACSDDNTNTPDWSNSIKGKWAGIGFYNATDTIDILMIADAENNKINGTADIHYNSEEKLAYVVSGTINDQTVTLTFNSIRNQMSYSGTFSATNPSIIQGTMQSTRFGTMNVTFNRRWT
jgi:hypothetical protein